MERQNIFPLFYPEKSKWKVNSMANSVYWKNCIREIRHTVYGRDNRKPIADAIEQLAENDFDKEKLDEMAAKLRTGVHSVIAEPFESWHTYDYRDIELIQIKGSDDFSASVITNLITLESASDCQFDSLDISFNETDYTFDVQAPDQDMGSYIAIDNVAEDSAVQISGEAGSYLWVIPNPVTHVYDHNGEDYMLKIARINGT